jgi:cytoskeleton protein RodZ
MQTTGSWLRSAREGKGCPLEQISRTTKINLLFLQALEEDRFEWLPGGMFPRAMVRAYARALGASEQEAASVYDAQFPPPPPAPPEPQRSSRAPLLAIGVAAMLIAIAAAVSILYWKTGATALATERVTAGESAVSVSASTPAVEPESEPEALTVESDAVVETPVLEETSLEGLNLQIQVLEECWLTLEADGTVVDRRLLKKGDAFTYHADNNFEALVGNAAALKFVINGEVWGNLGGAAQLKKIRIDKDDGKIRLTT